MKPETQTNQRKLFYYILPPLVIAFILLLIYRNANPPDRYATPGGGIQEEDSGRSFERDAPPPPKRDRDLTGGSEDSSRIQESDSRDVLRRTSFEEENPPSPYLVTNSRAITPQDDFIGPRFSPDGLDVICSKANYRGIYLVSIDGSEIRQLSDEFGIGYNVRWSEDGTKLIINHQGETRVIDLTGEEIDLTEDELRLLEQKNAYVKDDNVYIKDPLSGEDIKITSDEDAYYAVEMSPDGNKVAYQGMSAGIQIKDIETGEVIDIGSGSHFSWLPDGSGLIYNFTQDDGMNMIAGDIYFAYADGSGIFNITNTPDIIELNPRLSPDGRYLTYEIDGQVFVADLSQGF